VATLTEASSATSDNQDNLGTIPDLPTLKTPRHERPVHNFNPAVDNLAQVLAKHCVALGCIGVITGTNGVGKSEALKFLARSTDLLPPIRRHVTTSVSKPPGHRARSETSWLILKYDRLCINAAWRFLLPQISPARIHRAKNWPPSAG